MITFANDKKGIPLPLKYFDYSASEVSKLFKDFVGSATQFVSKFQELSMPPSTPPAAITVTGSGRKESQQEMDEILLADTGVENVSEAMINTPPNNAEHTSRAKRKLITSPTVKNPIVSPPKPKRKRHDDINEGDKEYTNSSDAFLAKLKKYEVAGK